MRNIRPGVNELGSLTHGSERAEVQLEKSKVYIGLGGSYAVGFFLKLFGVAAV